MNKQNRIREAIDVVIGWDLSDNAIGRAVIAQAQLLAAQPME